MNLLILINKYIKIVDEQLSTIINNFLDRVNRK